VSTLVPDAAHLRPVHDPPRQVDDRGGDGPDCELAHEAAYEADRAQECQQHCDAAEDQLPEPDRLEAEQLVAEQAGGGRDDDELEDRPAEALEHVERGGEVGAAPPERCALQHHRGHAGVCADQRRDGEHGVADHAADQRGRERIAQREIEVRRQDEYEQRDAEVRPEQERVERPEHAQALRNRLHSPLRRLHFRLPSLVLTRSGSTGVISAPDGAPRRVEG
jgi:hypothetical protein